MQRVKLKSADVSGDKSFNQDRSLAESLPNSFNYDIFIDISESDYYYI